MNTTIALSPDKQTTRNAILSIDAQAPPTRESRPVIATMLVASLAAIAGLLTGLYSILSSDIDRERPTIPVAVETFSELAYSPYCAPSVGCADRGGD